MSEFYYEQNQKSRERYDRYKNCLLLKDKETGESLVSTRDIDDIKSTSDDIYITVSAEQEHRLDLIADKYYDNPLLWWVIAQANFIVNPLLEPTVGDTIRIPSVYSLYGNNGILL